MTLEIGAGELVTLAVAAVVWQGVRAWAASREPTGPDTIPGSGMHQADEQWSGPPDQDPQGRVGFRAKT